MSPADMKSGEKPAAAREVLFFELEFVATSGRKGLYETVRGLFEANGMTVSPAAFSRCGATCRPAETVAALAGAMGGTPALANELAARAEELFVSQFCAQAEVDRSLPLLIETARQRSIQPVAVSAWPKDQAAALMSQLGLDALGVDLEAFDSHDPVFPRADHWLRMIKNRKQDSIPAMAIVSSHAACKGALTAGVTCIAVPDEFTSFADFSGARLILDSLGAQPADAIIAQVSRR